MAKLSDMLLDHFKLVGIELSNRYHGITFSKTIPTVVTIIYL